MLLLRGRLLSFNRCPQGQDDDSSYSYLEDGALLVGEGRIFARDTFEKLKVSYPNAQVIDHRPHLIMPGFIDTHIHFPQGQVIGSYGTQLLDWLNNYTFPQELKYADPVHAGRMAEAFLDNLLRHGTTSALVYGSVHKGSIEALFKAAMQRDMRLIAGKVMMDRNAPQGLCDTPQTSYEDSCALIEAWQDTGRLGYAITPRFAITSSPEQLEMAQALKKQYPDCYVQTHLSENHDEIAFTKQLYPKARDYLDVYEYYELLGPRSLFGHCIHLEPREIEAMAQSGCVAVFCPTSNLFLGSGLFDRARLEARSVRWSIATDVGGGTSYSMLRTLDEGYKILQLQGQKLDPLSAFYQITRGNAEALGLEGNIGTLDIGAEADLVVLDARATAAMALRYETVETLAEELFMLQTMGDDRAIQHVYLAGRSVFAP